MDAVLQKIKADIISRPLISALILTTIVAASTLLTLALATMMNIGTPYDRAFEDLNAAHLWLHFNQNKIRSRDIEWIQSLPGVAATTGLQYSVRTRVEFNDARVWTSLRVIPLETPAVNRLLLLRGRNLAEHETEILASKDLDDLYELSVNDTIKITRADGKEVELPVIGLAYNAMWDIYRNNQPPYLYVTEDTLRELFPDESTWDWSIGLRLTDPNAVLPMVSMIESELRSNAIDSYTDWRTVKSSAVFDARLSFILLGAFSFFAILATILVVASSISSIVLSQFKQIGMLKAIGFTKRQILLLYIGQYLILAIIGSVIGLLLGIFLSPIPLQNVAASMSTTFRPPLNILLIGLVFGIVPGIVIIASLGAAYRGARANIIKAIAIGAEAPKKKPFWGVKLATKLNLPMTFILGLDDISARPFRSLMTGLNLTLGVIGIVFGLTLNQTIELYTIDRSLLGIVYDAKVTRVRTSDGKTQRVLSRAPGVEAFYGETLIDANLPDGQSFRVRAVEGDVTAFPFNISKGRFFPPNSYEAMAGKGLLDWLGLEIGDELTVTLEDKDRPLTWQIVGQYTEPFNRGQILMVSLPTVARTVKQAKPQNYFLKLSSGVNTDQLTDYIEPNSDSDLDLTILNQVLPDSVFYLQLGVWSLDAILIGIALINVFNTSLLAVQEKIRTVGILKTLGMTPAQVVTMVNTSAGFLGLVATVVGLPLGLVFTKGFLTIMSDYSGFGEVTMSLNFFYAILLLPLVVGISVAGSFIPGHRAAKVSIVQVLRNE